MAFRNSLLVSLCLVALVASAQSRYSPSASEPTDSPDYFPIDPPSTSLPPSESPAESPLSSVSIDLDHTFLENPSDLSTNMISTAGSYPIVTKICAKTDHPDLCFATVVPFLNGSRVDLDSVLKITVDAGGEYAKVALAAVKKLAKSKDNSAGVKMTLRDCKDSYDVAVENFGKSAEAFAVKDIGTARSMLSAAMTFVGDCEDEFVQIQEPSPMAGYSEKVTAFASNCLAIIEQMLTQ